MFLGSDAIALSPFTDTIAYLEDGDWAVLTRKGVTVYDENNSEVERPIQKTQTANMLVSKGNHRHFMQKEMFEQPEVISHTLANYLDFTTGKVRQEAIGIDFSKIDRLTISACGTAYYAASVGKYWFEQIARLPVDSDIASEFRYREMPLSKDRWRCSCRSQAKQRYAGFAALLQVARIEDRCSRECHRLDHCA